MVKRKILKFIIYVKVLNILFCAPLRFPCGNFDHKLIGSRVKQLTGEKKRDAAENRRKLKKYRKLYWKQ